MALPRAGELLRVSDLATSWSTAAITLATDWTQTDTTATRDTAIRIEGDTAVMTGTMFNRVNSGLAVNPGVAYDLLTVDADYRPPSLTLVEAGSIGVAGNLGVAALWVTSGGILQFIPHVAAGTIATTGGFQNYVGTPTLHWRISA